MKRRPSSAGYLTRVSTNSYNTTVLQSVKGANRASSQAQAVPTYVMLLRALDVAIRLRVPLMLRGPMRPIVFTLGL
ncbi:hypothetical protein BJX62DRAFT_194648 [Aspergillus germanicus]